MNVDAVIAIAADHPATAGHFPGRPILPGALLLDLVIRAACDAGMPLAAELSAPIVKFHAAVLPGQQVRLRFDARGSSIAFEGFVHTTRVVSGTLSIVVPP
ncbi:MAG: hypothetical protein KIT73_06310 [Burkholderiales bacterium]|nr:hypothetical protein [Burkholderiales bacterium]